MEDVKSDQMATKPPLGMKEFPCGPEREVDELSLSYGPVPPPSLSSSGVSSLPVSAQNQRSHSGTRDEDLSSIAYSRTYINSTPPIVETYSEIESSGDSSSLSRENLADLIPKTRPPPSPPKQIKGTSMDPLLKKQMTVDFPLKKHDKSSVRWYHYAVLVTLFLLLILVVTLIILKLTSMPKKRSDSGLYSWNSTARTIPLSTVIPTTSFNSQNISEWTKLHFEARGTFQCLTAEIGDSEPYFTDCSGTLSQDWFLSHSMQFYSRTAKKCIDMSDGLWKQRWTITNPKYPLRLRSCTKQQYCQWAHKYRTHDASNFRFTCSTGDSTYCIGTSGRSTFRPVIVACSGRYVTYWTIPG